MKRLLLNTFPAGQIPRGKYVTVPVQPLRVVETSEFTDSARVGFGVEPFGWPLVGALHDRATAAGSAGTRRNPQRAMRYHSEGDFIALESRFFRG